MPETATDTAVQLPPCDYEPPAYTGPSRQEVLGCGFQLSPAMAEGFPGLLDRGHGGVRDLGQLVLGEQLGHVADGLGVVPRHDQAFQKRIVGSVQSHGLCSLTRASQEGNR